jgi:hypothetical protein
MVELYQTTPKGCRTLIERSFWGSSTTTWSFFNLKPRIVSSLTETGNFRKERQSASWKYNFPIFQFFNPPQRTSSSNRSNLQLPSIHLNRIFQSIVERIADQGMAYGDFFQEGNLLLQVSQIMQIQVVTCI